MTRTRTICTRVGIGVAAVLLLNLVALSMENPGEAARTQAQELGWQRSDIAVVAGGYSSSLLSRTSYLRFRSKSRPECGEIFVKVRKATPLHPWSLSEYAQGQE